MTNKSKKKKIIGETTDKVIEVPCDWIKIPKSSFLLSEERKHTRCGQYHQSVFPQVPGYGMKSWVVCGYLKIREPEKFKHLSENQLVEGCVAFLNQPPPRKRKPLYGFLAPVPAPWRGVGKYDVRVREDDMIVCFSTDDRRNKNFWGDGLSLVVKVDGRKAKKKK